MRSADSAVSRRRSGRMASHCRSPVGRAAQAHPRRDTDTSTSANRRHRPRQRHQPLRHPPLNRAAVNPAAAGRGRAGNAGCRAHRAAPVEPRQRAQPDPDDDDNEVVVAGLVGSGGGGLTPLVFAAREGDLESAKLLLDAGAQINQVTEYGWTPLLTAVNNRNYQLAKLPAREGRRSEHRQQGRLDAALSRDRQPQHRGRRLSGSQGGHGSPRHHPAAAREGRGPEQEGQGQHPDAHDLHDAVVLRGWRDGVHPRGAVERHRADEAAAEARRRSARPPRRSATTRSPRRPGSAGSKA